VSKQWQADRRFEPALDPASVKALRADWQRALGRSKAWAQ
jgi:hypothetical protein